MKGKRLWISLLLGLIFGLFCAWGTASKFPGKFDNFTLLSIVYNRVLIGLFIGIAGNIKLGAALRGIIFGAVVSLQSALPGFSEGIGSLVLVFAGMIYGLIIDLVATKFS